MSGNYFLVQKNFTGGSINNLSVSGTAIFNSLSASTFSAGTINSGTTNLYSIFVPIGSAGFASTQVQPGTNITTGGTATNPIVSTIASPIFNSLTVSGTGLFNSLSSTTLSAGTYYSGSTPLQTILNQIITGSTGGSGTVTGVEPGSNITTGGTASNPIISLVNTPSIQGLITSGNVQINASLIVTGTGNFNIVSATTLSASTHISGSTNLYGIFQQLNTSTLGVGPGSNITTGGTQTEPIINLVASPSINNLTLSGTGNFNIASATTLSAATHISGSTNLYGIFQQLNTSILGVGPGSNITTGGTQINPIVNLVSSPSINGLTASGTVLSNIFSSTTISGGTYYSGSTPLWNIIYSTITGNTNSPITASNGLTKSNNNIILGGALTGITTIGTNSSNYIIINNLSSATISGTVIYDNIGFKSIDANNRVLTDGVRDSVDYGTRFLVDSDGVNAMDYDNRCLIDNNNFISIDFRTRVLNDTNPTISLDYLNRNLAGTSGTTVLNWNNSGIIVTGAVSANTFYSGSTNLYQIFQKLNTSTLGIGPGSNITTGDTQTEPIINLVASPSVNGLTVSGTGNFNIASATTLSAGTIYSGSTPLTSIFVLAGSTGATVNSVGTGANITNTGTASNPIIALINSPSIQGLTTSGNVQVNASVTITGNTISNGISGNTLSGGTIFSATTNLYGIFQQLNTSTLGVGPGSNITTGGTQTNPIINIVSSPSFNNETGSGTSTWNAFSSTTISGGTYYSGSTSLWNIIFSTVTGNTSSSTGSVNGVEPGTNITTGGTATNPTINLVASPSINALTTSGNVQVNASLTITGNTFSNSISGNTVSGGTVYSASTNLYQIFQQLNTTILGVGPGSNITTGGTQTEPVINLIASPSVNNLTVSGTGNFNIASATTLSASTMISGSTNLYGIFQQLNAGVLGIEQGSNIITGGTQQNPTINLTNSPSIQGLTTSGNVQINASLTITGTTLSSNISGTTVSGGTIYSASTNLYQVFQQLNTTILGVGPGSNIITGGTQTEPIIILASSPSVNGLTVSGTGNFNVTSATTLSASTYISGSTNLYNIFTQLPQVGVVGVGPGSNITTGGTASNPIITLVASPSINQLTTSGNVQVNASLTITGTTLSNGISGNTVSGGTIYSAATNLYQIFQQLNTSTLGVGPGSNITTGGTQTNPIINLVSSPSINVLTTSGNVQVNASLIVTGATLSNTISGTTISGGTIYSGNTNLYSIFSTIGSGGGSGTVTGVGPGSNIITGGTTTNPIINVVASPSFNNQTGSGTSTWNIITATTISANTEYIEANLLVNANTLNVTNPERLLVIDGIAGTSGYSNVIVGKAGVNNYAQLNIINTFSGNNASADIIATADNGTENTNYVDLGINSSTFNGYIGSPNDAYVYSQANNFWVGNTTSGQSVFIFTDGSLSSNVRIAVSSGATTFYTPISATSIYINPTPTNNNADTQILTLNPSTNIIEYAIASAITTNYNYGLTFAMANTYAMV